jgi:hypothetical protein
MQIPSQIIAGDSQTWRDVSLRDYLGNSVDSVTYALTYSLRGPGQSLDLTGNSYGTGWEFTLSPTQSAALNTTRSSVIWYWQAYASKTGARVTAGDGTLLVRPNLQALSAGTYDGSSQAEKDLAAVQAEISARITGGATLEYTIGSRSLKKEPMAALVEIEQRCKRIVQRERRAQAIKNGLGNPGRVGVRFK